jgi:hypothetical protein
LLMGIGVVVVVCLVAVFWTTRRQPAVYPSEQSDTHWTHTRDTPPTADTRRSLLKKKVHFADEGDAGDAGDEEFVHAPISIEQD